MRCFRHTQSGFYLVSPCQCLGICKNKGHARQSPASCFSSEEIVNQLSDMILVVTHQALAPVPTRELVALVDHPGLAVSPGEADGTGAGVVLAGVEAGGAVVTRPVVCAEVEVLAAHLAAPALLAFTGPRGGARPVHAPGVDLTLLALSPLPALVTSKKQKLR